MLKIPKITKTPMSRGFFFGNDIISLDQLTENSIYTIFQKADDLRKQKPKELLKILSGKIITLLFFEPSSRTFGSNVAAIKRLGGQTIEFQNMMQTSSVIKGESLEDTARVFANYCDLIVIRHPQKGSVKKFADSINIPVINAGDGIGEHPTQALLDLYTIKRKIGRLVNIKGLVTGDILNGRTTHSLIKGLLKFKNNTIYLLSPKELCLAKEDFIDFSKRGIKLIQISKEKEIPTDLDFWYWTRVQKERFANIQDYEKVKNKFIITPKLLKNKGNEKMIVMHPLPRVGEIDLQIDSDKRAVYLNEQILNGMYIRMALMKLILCRK